jgi:hypothetical protein
MGWASGVRNQTDAYLIENYVGLISQNILSMVLEFYVNVSVYFTIV